MNELYPFCPYGRKGLDDVLTGICSPISPYINELWKAKNYCECQVRHPGMFCSEPVSDEFRTLTNGIQHSADIVNVTL